MGRRLDSSSYLIKSGVACGVCVRGPALRRAARGAMALRETAVLPFPLIPPFLLPCTEEAGALGAAVAATHWAMSCVSLVRLQVAGGRDVFHSLQQLLCSRRGRE